MDAPAKLPKPPLTTPLDSSKVLQAKLAKVNRILNAEVQLPFCDDCLEDSSENDQKEVPRAEVYCRNCRQMLCSDCCVYHRRARACRAHVLVAFEKKDLDCDFSVDSKVPGVCKRHTDKQHLLNTFCYDCNEAICRMCIDDVHFRHRHTDVTDVSDRFRKEILEHLSLCLSSEELVLEKKEQMVKEQNDCRSLVQKIEAEIERTRDELKRLVDRQADLLLLETQLLQEERTREIETFSARIDDHLTQVDGFKSCASEITNRGSVSDVCQSVADLKIVNNILENDTKGIVQSELRLFPISFTVGHFKELMANDGLSYFGKIEGKCAYMIDPCNPVSISKEHSPNMKFISGIAILNKEVFVTRYKTSEISVYDSSYQPNRSMKFERSGTSWKEDLVLRDPHCISSCSFNQCLYIVNRREKESSEIVKIDTSGSLLKRWAVPDNSYGRISVTGKGNIVKILHTKSQLIEYTSEGQIIREVTLSDCIQRPWHAIQKQNGDFVVSHGQYGDKHHRVCLVDSDGRVKNSFSMEISLDNKYLNCPVYLALCEDGTIMCIDANNRRVLMLSSMLEFQRELLTKISGIEGRPHALFIDEVKKHLLITYEEKFIAFEMRNSAVSEAVLTDPNRDTKLKRLASTPN